MNDKKINEIISLRISKITKNKFIKTCEEMNISQGFALRFSLGLFFLWITDKLTGLREDNSKAELKDIILSRRRFGKRYLFREWDKIISELSFDERVQIFEEEQMLLLEKDKKIQREIDERSKLKLNPEEAKNE